MYRRQLWSAVKKKGKASPTEEQASDPKKSMYQATIVHADASNVHIYGLLLYTSADLTDYNVITESEHRDSKRSETESNESKQVRRKKHSTAMRK